MCGIICLHGQNDDIRTDLSHRGPDECGEVTVGNTRMIFYRLAINGLGSQGMQPFLNADRTAALICNGEIFNHKELGDGVASTGSDCECLLKLMTSGDPIEQVRKIRGEFAFVFSDGVRVLAARDPLGVRPLFVSHGPGGVVRFASEMKALRQFGKVDIFPPGCIYDNGVTSWYYEISRNVTAPTDPRGIREGLEEAIRIRVGNTEQPVGFLLSGGLDSSIVAAVASKCLDEPIRTFSIGMEGSKDLASAKIVADYLGTKHTEILFKPEELWDIIPNVVWSLETWDTTTIRAGTPMWVLAKWISDNTDIKVIVSGEGSDELFGGYLYFHYAPSQEEFQEETVRRLELIHQFDGLRADRSLSAHGLELRCPFLDHKFVDHVVSIDPVHKICNSERMEKYILREAFEGELPREILWRQKDGMSDGVGHGWVDFLKNMGESVYGEAFDAHFPCQAHLISERWMPKWTDVTDPSARVLDVKNV